MVYRLEERYKTKDIFGNWQEAVVWSTLQGVMGDIYVDDLEAPSSAKALLGGFAILAGKPSLDLVVHKPESYDRDSVTLVPQDESWSRIIEAVYGDKAERLTRYAIKKDGDVFDRNHLKSIVEGLEDEYEIKLIDEELFYKCRGISWCKSFVIQYEDFSFYKEHGLGVVILKDGIIVAGASSYLGYEGGIDIDIHTREDFRRRGLASIAGARLILECLERGLYPSWDAKNTMSVELAKKLGYHFSHEYRAYEVSYK